MSFADSFKIEAVLEKKNSGNGYKQDVDKHVYNYRNLVLEGGGILGIAYCGALEELHSRGILKHIINYAGSSAGSIVAGMLACGASFNFLLKELSETNFESFMDYGNRIRAIYNLYYYNGMAPGDVFTKWYSDAIEKLTGDRDITLGAIHAKYGGRLVITGTSLDQREIVYFDHRSHPNMLLVQAVRISMSIPGLFIPVNYLGEVFVDGSVLNNYPIDVFHKDVKGPMRINSKTIGLMLVSNADTKPPKVTGFSSFIAAMYGCYMKQVQKAHMDPSDWARTIKIPCGDISSFDFNLDDKAKAALVQYGKDAVRTYFEDKHIDQNEYIAKNAPVNIGYRESDEIIPDMLDDKK